ncbi:MAG: glycosyltransferase [Acetilactobacillus jinshanensis]
MRMLPINRHTVVFDSYWASQFSSNEKAIYEYISRHYPKMKTVWFFKNRQIPINGKGKRVKVNSLKYWYYMATAKYLFQNTNLPNQYFKRPGQIETETLHGTFLKHMGFDEPHFKNASRRVQDNFARRNRRWDYMVVPSKYMERIASNAFDYHQKIIPSGFPRNDELINHNNQKYINSIKHKLNIPLNKKVILYAPTYRKHQRFDFPLDLGRLERELGNKYVFLVRLHYFVAHSGSFYDNPGFVYDVSDYPDINDLYLISDVLITDYSSVMFDYAYLKRPMIFYPYDETLYLDDRNRGTYLDYDSSMPGPIVKTESSLIHALNNLDKVRYKYHDKSSSLLIDLLNTVARGPLPNKSWTPFYRLRKVN